MKGNADVIYVTKLSYRSFLKGVEAALVIVSTHDQSSSLSRGFRKGSSPKVSHPGLGHPGVFDWPAHFLAF